MAQPKLGEVVLMFLTVMVGVGILLLVGTALIHFTGSSIPPSGNGGVGFSVSRFSVNLFAMSMAALVAIVVMIAVWFWKR
jgi:hypothetical protein